MISTLKSRALSAINHTKTCVRKCLVCGRSLLSWNFIPEKPLKGDIIQMNGILSGCVVQVFLVKGLPLYCYSDSTRYTTVYQVEHIQMKKARDWTIGIFEVS